MVKKNTCVFISGKGSNLINLIKRSREYNFPIAIKLVICNNKDAFGINYAKKISLPLLIINTKSRNYENQILRKLERYEISFICLAGYMKILPNKILRKFKKKLLIFTLFTAKIQRFEHLQKDFRKKERKTGCTVHFVNDKLDSGKIIIQKFFYIKKEDSELSLEGKNTKVRKFMLCLSYYKNF